MNPNETLEMKLAMGITMAALAWGCCIMLHMIIKGHD